MLYPVQWSTNTYGLDGPWQAVSVQVGGYYGRDDPPDQAGVDLIPGGDWDTYVLSPTTCGQNKTADCGKGGTWDPLTIDNGALSEQTADNSTIFFEPSTLNDAGSGRYLGGKLYGQNIKVNALASNSFPKFQVPNSTIVSATYAYHIWPNGRQTSIDVGTLALGAQDPTQVFNNISLYTIPGYLSNSSQASNTYGLQLGSVQLNYTGSLIFGGYDKGRGLGPVTSWSGTTDLQLQDITLGVETGGSPWTFNNKTGLLLNEQSQTGPLSVLPQPLSPYLGLPAATCSGLAKVLPIYYDSSAKYYLWNTSDPTYNTTIKSAAYLGFVFPGTASGQVTVKVPMLYLNLTLMPAASGLDKPVQYFPCQAYNPSDNKYVLGRSFLQAAFIGRNWAHGIGTSWLAQAPGPGSIKQGLGYTPTEIQNGDSSISFNSDTSLFNASMAGYWSPLPVPGQNSSSNINSTTPSPEPSQSSNGELSTGAKAGIGVGVAVLALILIGLAAFFFIHRRRRNQAVAANQHSHGEYYDSKPPMYASGQPNNYEPHEIMDQPHRYYEVAANPAANPGMNTSMKYNSPATNTNTGYAKVSNSTPQELDAGAHS